MEPQNVLDLTRVVGVNRAGRDLVVGDVHGCFRTLERALSDLGFDPDSDRLFGVGDLVDRGPRSEDALYWLEDRFHTVTLGNHERPYLEWFHGKILGSCERVHGWLWKVHRDEYRRWFGALAGMPLAMTIATLHGPVGVVHAQVPDPDWSRALELLSAGAEEIVDIALLGYATEREEAGARARPVKGLRALVHGHRTVREIEMTHNRWAIDTGAGVRGLNRLTLVRGVVRAATVESALRLALASADALRSCGGRPLGRVAAGGACPWQFLRASSCDSASSVMSALRTGLGAGGPVHLWWG